MYQLRKRQRAIVRSFHPRFVWLIGIIVGLLIVMILAVTVFFSFRQTADVHRHEVQLAQGFVDSQLRELRRIAEDYAQWDEAFVNLVEQSNHRWANRRFGPAVLGRYGFDMVFVLDGSGRMTYGMVGGSPYTGRIKDILKNGLLALLRERLKSGTGTSVVGTILVNNQLALAAVAPLRPFDRPDHSSIFAQHTLVLVEFMTQDQLDATAAVLGLDELQVVDSGLATESAIPLVTADGRVVRQLAWEGKKPGRAILLSLLPPLLLLLTGIAGATGFVLHQAMESSTRLQASEARASRDMLTGLPNRLALTERLQALTASQRSMPEFSIMYLDLDGFKIVNDTYGHDVGDEVLRETARRMRALLPTGSNVYRLGGDEFAALLLGQTDVAAVRALGERMIRRVSSPIEFDGIVTRVGITIGVALSPTEGVMGVDLLRKADQALYFGKRTQKGTVRFYLHEDEKLIA
ncbi:diguanylate cyclase [Aureimonas fodinaquatilis]|uniref:Diguanylate cyclase n=1 Tax=Aureimonas fodinaquatilis TaxID=2565783 RepID=A0A5B0DRA0_9HYPH|nr:diguanylate cyclase [Aureimonas fodinaquatilis]KAA0968522.1 diguanylate cyclase [Aureimonas fodinaquatilis]